MLNLIKPIICIVANTFLALLLLFVFGATLVNVVITSFLALAMSLYAAPSFGMDSEKSGMVGLFAWFIIFGAIVLPAAFLTLEASKYNFWGKTAENVGLSEIEKYSDYDRFYFSEVKPLPQFTERYCKTSKSGKSGSTTTCYNAFPLTDGKDGGVYKVWAVYGDYDSKDDFATAKAGIRVNSDFAEYQTTSQNAVKNFNLKSAETPVFITLTANPDQKIQAVIWNLILAFIVCVLLGTIAKGYLMYLDRKEIKLESGQ